MKIQTFSIICGTSACDAKCPYCVSKMTPDCGVNAKSPEINWRNFRIACDLAQKAGVTTAMLTGKGEPTLWPELVESYLKELQGRFPLIEVQTNGISISDGRVKEYFLKSFYEKGLTTIAISIVHWEDDKNRRIYLPDKATYPSLSKLIEKLHNFGFSVRLNCTLLRDYVGRWADALDLINFAKKYGVEQLTLIPVNSPSNTTAAQAKWIAGNCARISELQSIRHELEDHGSVLMELAHGALVFDYEGQNVCLSNCLNNERYTDKSVMRNLIFYPDGHLRYDWEHAGAILL